MGIADKDYFLNANGELAENEEDAATLLVRAGQEVSKDMADKYGIGKVAQGETDGGAPDAKAAESATSNKAAKSPATNKGAK